MGARTPAVNGERAGAKSKPLPMVETSPARVLELSRVLREHSGGTMIAQCERMLYAMHTAPITPRDARKWLAVTHPAECVRLLKKEGILVSSTRIRLATSAGASHRTVAYALADV